MDDLEIQELQTVVFGFRIYEAFAEHVGADPDGLPTTADLDAALAYVIDRIGPEGKRKSHTDRFVEIFGRAAIAGYVERGEHYTLVREGQPDREEVRINLPRTFDALSKYVRDHGIESEDLLNAAGDYRDRFAELAEDSTSYVACVRQYTPPVSKCTGILTVQAMTGLDFDRNALDTKEPMAGDVSLGGGETAAADGGEDTHAKAAEKAKRLLNAAKKPKSKQWVVMKLLERHTDLVDDDPEKAEAAFDRAKREGMIAETPGGDYESGAK